MQDRRFPAVQALIQGIQRTSADTLDLLALTGAIVDVAIEHEVDPYAMLDVLEEAVVSTIIQLPPEKRMAAAVATMRLMLNGL